VENYFADLGIASFHALECCVDLGDTINEVENGSSELGNEMAHMSKSISNLPNAIFHSSTTLA
jgi:hypothetical protein